MITNRHIISAAHCFYEIKLNAIATLGTTSLDTADNAVHYSIKKVYIHPKYNHTGIENDVAVLELGEEVKFTGMLFLEKKKNKKTKNKQLCPYAYTTLIKGELRV